MLKKIRLEKGLKAYKIAELLGVSRKQFFRIETGDAKSIDAHKKKLSEIYNISIEQLEEAWEGVKNAN